MTAIHETLRDTFGQYIGRVFCVNPVPQLEAALNSALQAAVLQDLIFSGHCPIEVVVFEDEARPGHVGWYFRVTDPSDILWFSIHKDHVDHHFPMALFPERRPDLPLTEQGGPRGPRSA